MRTISKGLVSLRDNAAQGAKNQNTDEQSCGKCYLVRGGLSTDTSDCKECFSGTSARPDTLILPRVWTGINARSVLLAVEDLYIQPTPENRINIDLSRVEYIDSSGLGALVGIRKTIAKKQMTVRLINVDKHIQGLLETANFDRLFEIN
ncbi:STAS domain-containing protein [Alteromonas gilva]|uniref:STAS domain-containing protein n=1 Tax=Alteromonas gilva TaxID=2987522 RepID=A0ABT5KYF1_9ALTE|nr:STAS domain-containing protein [Alteromonas gilva]MDC8829805.1 STAS domain-containing protein [Alteromonas gilva]